MERDLARTRRWIADEERRETERRHSIAARPPEPDWLTEQSLNRDEVRSRRFSAPRPLSPLALPAAG